MVSSVALSPGEELRFRQETLAHLRQQRIQQVREREKQRAKNNAKVFQHKQKQLQNSEALLAKQQELTTLLKELDQLETLKCEQAEQFGEAHALAAHLRAQTMVEGELNEKKSLEESKTRAKRFLEALEAERAPLMAKALAASQAAERRKAIRAEEEARAKEAAAAAVFPPPNEEEKRPHVVITSDENGNIDYSKTRFHVWPGGVDGPLGLGPPPKPTPLVSLEQQQENERCRTYTAFKTIRAEKEARQVEKTLEEAAKHERLLKIARKPFGVPKTIKVPAPPIVPSREREILWDVTNINHTDTQPANIKHDSAALATSSTRTPPVPSPRRVPCAQERRADPVSSSTPTPLASSPRRVPRAKERRTARASSSIRTPTAPSSGCTPGAQQGGAARASSSTRTPPAPSLGRASTTQKHRAAPVSPSTRTPPEPLPESSHGAQQHGTVLASTSQASQQPAAARTTVESERCRVTSGQRSTHRPDIVDENTPPRVMDDVGASSSGAEASNSRAEASSRSAHEKPVRLSCASSSASVVPPAAHDGEDAFLTAEEQAWIRRHLAMSIEKEDSLGADITVWSDHVYSPQNSAVDRT